METTYAPIGHATRVTFHEAKRHFANGGSVLVSDSDRGYLRREIYRSTTTHSKDSTTWDALAADVRMWRNRYPNQRFYIVEWEGES